MAKAVSWQDLIPKVEGIDHETASLTIKESFEIRRKMLSMGAPVILGSERHTYIVLKYKPLGRAMAFLNTKIERRETSLEYSSIYRLITRAVEYKRIRDAYMNNDSEEMYKINDEIYKAIKKNKKSKTNI
jgi:hypothetical protein